ncbi:hypothetical protein C4D60_Mb09t06340 [Musa balbisiana]|uniref:Ninja-family protein n=1 Tax=Musa balbisiana TaxID=52838 RepID=A0A4S8IEK3_MUSBA|nr:hypothetical protein C4D60_Mb09t06340 [Musa balbisiana]
MPSVSTRGDGPNGRRIEGLLYRYKKGEDVRIVCVCHGSFLTPAEFVKHAGEEDPLKKVADATTDASLRRNMMENMPFVSTRGDGPNGRRIEGLLYRYKKGEDVRIVCVCHGSFLTPAEFVKHAGEEDPLKKVADATTDASLRRNMMEDVPFVSTRGDGPNGRRIEGLLYRYKKGEDVRIVCVCHGSFLTPAEFVKHAGEEDPLKKVADATTDASLRRNMMEDVPFVSTRGDGPNGRRIEGLLYRYKKGEDILAMALASKLGNLLKQAVNPSLLLLFFVLDLAMALARLSYGTDDQSLRESFTSFGEVVEARVIVDRDTGRSRGFGFVTFTSGEEASAAISGMDGKDLHGRMVRVNYATDRTGGFRGGYGGGGYGGGGSGYGGSGGGYSGGGGYGGNTGGYGSVGGSFGGYGGGSGGENYPTAGGTGGSGSYASGASGNNFGSSGGFYGDNATTQSNSNFSGRDGSYGNNNQDDLLEDNFKDADDEPEDYAKRG